MVHRLVSLLLLLFFFESSSTDPLSIYLFIDIDHHDQFCSTWNVHISKQFMIFFSSF
uniref:Secreted protein n=1 Tax=Phakopsora pachyrhizi TaxID=170000 RepID=A0A0S1MKC3_PHAPC